MTDTQNNAVATSAGAGCGCFAWLILLLVVFLPGFGAALVDLVNRIAR